MAALTFGLEHTKIKRIQRRPRVSPLYRVSCGWSKDVGEVYSGGLSGYHLLQLTGQATPQPKKIILLGYDMKYTPDGRRHCHPDHAPPFNNVPKLREQVPYFDVLARQSPIPIVNCTRDSALRCFPVRPLREVLR
jgi:hypothetical protein